MSDLSGKTLFITGASRGIGKAIALRAAQDGANIAVVAKTAEPHPRLPGTIHSAAEELREAGGRALAIQLDVRDPDAIEAAVQRTVEEFGGIDVLVNNAGYGYVSAVEEGVDEDVRRMFDTNFFGAIELIKAVLPGMRARRDGYVLNVSSMTGLVSNPANVYYSASKFALESLTEGLSKEMAPLGVRVSAVEPGLFRTDWSSRSMQESAPTIEDYADTIGVRRELIRKHFRDFIGIHKPFVEQGYIPKGEEARILSLSFHTTIHPMFFYRRGAYFFHPAALHTHRTTKNHRASSLCDALTLTPCGHYCSDNLFFRRSRG